MSQMLETTLHQFALIVIGDENLIGQRRDRHFAHFRATLEERGMQIGRYWLLPDREHLLVEHLRFSMAADLPAFVCGGIGATPDDLTRACAAQAADVPLRRHPRAVALIEEKFGADAYPMRIRMAELPEGCELIPNPINDVPGFGLNRHYFLPGFPQMAWPMAAWVLDQYYPARADQWRERALKVLDTPESGLILVMERLGNRHPGLKMFSLPKIADPVTGVPAHVELGFRGTGDIDAAIADLAEELNRLGIPHEAFPCEGAT